MAGSVEIRRAGVADVPQLALLFDLYRQFYRQAADLDGAIAFLTERLEREQSVAFLATDGADPMGFTQLFPSFTSAGMARTFILNDLFVAQAARGRGVGTALLRQAAQFARDEGAVRLFLSTAIDNHAAQSLYEREGWERDEAFFTYRLRVAD